MRAVCCVSFMTLCDICAAVFSKFIIKNIAVFLCVTHCVCLIPSALQLCAHTVLRRQTPRRFGVFITPAADFDITEKLLDTMEPGSLSEPMVTNEMERIAINVKDADHKMECEQKSESGSMEKTAAKSDKTNHTEELPPFVPLQRATQSSPNRESHTVPSRADKKSPKPRKRSQPVRGDLIPDPDKLLSYKKHEGHKKEEEEMEDPTVPGGMKPREPRLPGDEAAERKKSTVTFSTVVETIDA